MASGKTRSSMAEDVELTLARLLLLYETREASEASERLPEEEELEGLGAYGNRALLLGLGGNAAEREPERGV